MSEDTTSGQPVGDVDVGSSVHDVESGDEIGTIRDYDDDHVYVDPNDEFEGDDQLAALGWRATDGSFEIDTDAIRGLPEDAEGDHGVDLSGYEDPDDGPGDDSG